MSPRMLPPMVAGVRSRARIGWGWAWVAVAALLLALATWLLVTGRSLTCPCGVLALWSGDIWSNQNSQQVADPYSFTHIEHGVLFFWGLQLAWRSASVPARLVAATAIEAAWEAWENSDFIINRYRETTISLDYFGDSVINSAGDVAFCVVGFMVAWRISGRLAALGVIVTETVLAIWIRDGLLLNIVMLVYPVEAIRQWQTGG